MFESGVKGTELHLRLSEDRDFLMTPLPGN